MSTGKKKWAKIYKKVEKGVDKTLNPCYNKSSNEREVNSMYRVRFEDGSWAGWYGYDYALKVQKAFGGKIEKAEY